MTRLLNSLLIVAALAMNPGHAGAGDCATPDGRFNNFLIARTPTGTTPDAFIAAVQSDYPGLLAVTRDSVPERPIYLLEITLPDSWDDNDIDSFEESLEEDYTAVINWAEFLYEDEAPEGTTGSTLVDGLASLNDFQNQYAADAMQLPAAHLRSSGTGIVVAVLDTGIDFAHPHFAGHVVPGGWDYVDGDALPEETSDDTDNDGDGLTDEMHGHGTFVAGLITIVAPDASILPIRVLDDEGHGNLWTLACGLFHAIDHGVEVINVSITSTYNSQAVEDALDEANSHGIAVVAAAGNCNRSDPREFPGMNGDEVIGVTAVNDLDIRGAFSNFDDKIYLSAPGVTQIVAGDPVVNRSIISTIPGGTYGYWQGTSMAAPLVAGTAALVRAQYPEWPANLGTYFNLRALLGASAVNIDALNPGYEELLGVGRVDSAAALDLGPIAPSLGDLDADGLIGLLDMLILLGDWGEVHSSADLDGDGLVGILDLLLLFGAWS